MAEMVEIRVFECEGCGRRETWLDWEMPGLDGRSWSSTDECRSEALPCCVSYVRPARIAAADLRYVRRFGKGPRVDVTAYT